MSGSAFILRDALADPRHLPQALASRIFWIMLASAGCASCFAWGMSARAGRR